MEGSDVLLIGAIVFAMAIAFFAVKMMSDSVVDAIVDVPAIQESTASVEAFEGIKSSTDRTDYLIFGLYIGLMLAMLVTSWFIRLDTIWVVVYVIVIILSVPLGAVLSNTWETATQSSVFGDTISSFPISNNLMLNLPIYNAIISCLALILLFSKPYIRREGD